MVEPKTIARSLLKRYTLALVILAGMALSSFIVISDIISKQNDGAFFVNATGRQRMLSQRMALMMRLVREGPEFQNGINVFEELKSSLYTMKVEYELIRKGNAEHDASIFLSPKIQELYENKREGLDLKVTQLFDLISSFIQAYETADPLLVTYEQEAQQRLLDILEPLNQAVLLYQEEVEARMLNIKRVESAILLISFLVLLLEFLFIFRPATNMVRQYGESLIFEMKRLELIIAMAKDAIAVFHTDGTVHIANDAFRKLFKAELDETRYLRLHDFLVGQDSQYENIITKKSLEQAVQMEGLRSDGTSFPAEISVGCVSTQGRNIFVASVRDATYSKKGLEELQRLAFHDSLTNLANRLFLSEELPRALERTRRQNGCGALLFLDLDGFKEVNDNYGHDVGDKLLTLVAKRLQGLCRSTDLVARYAGDEFAVVLEGLEGESSLHEIGNKIVVAISEPYSIEGLDIAVTASVGISDFSGQSDVDAIFKKADSAMYMAKAAGKSGYRIAS